MVQHVQTAHLRLPTHAHNLMVNLGTVWLIAANHYIDCFFLASVETCDCAVTYLLIHGSQVDLDHECLVTGATYPC